MTRDGDVTDGSVLAELREHVITELVVFSRVLRDAGVTVPANSTITAARALGTVGFGDEDTVRAALRSVLVTREKDIPTFDRLFPAFWRRLTTGPKKDETDAETTLDDGLIGGAVPEIDQSGASDAPTDPSDRDDQIEEDLGPIENHIASEPAEEGEFDAESVRTSVYSPTGESAKVTVGPRHFEREDAITRAVDRLGRAIAETQGRRWTSGEHERIDTRRALRQSVGTGGAVFSLPGKERARSIVNTCVLVDVSQSVLDTVDRGFLVGFLRAVSESWRNVRLFFFDTSVQEVTSAFDARTPQSAVDALQRAETEWGGGTRIGNAIEMVRRTAPDAIDRETVVIVISDGLEVGELDVLADGMSWLSRRATGVVWLNPLAGSLEYEPTCRGMEIALPYVDGVFAFTGVRDIEEVARQVERHGLSGPIGYEYDHRRVGTRLSAEGGRN